MIMYKNIKDLSIDELKKVLDVNQKLQNEVYEDYQESEMYYITEILDNFKDSLSDWSIGFNNSNYIKVKDDILFLESIKDVQADYCFLADADYNDKEIDDLIEKINKFNYEDMSEEEADELENFIGSKINKYKSLIINTFNQFTDTDAEDVLSYFIEFYSDERLSEDCYIDDNFILYENISYIKSYS